MLMTAQEERPMPLYEFRCRACGHSFEILIGGGATPVCPLCGGQDLERLLSSFGVSSTTTREMALRSGRRQLKRLERDKTAEQREVIEKHDH
jgi:putative FmdB family regulatory protein